MVDSTARQAAKGRAVGEDMQTVAAGSHASVREHADIRRAGSHSGHTVSAAKDIRSLGRMVGRGYTCLCLVPARLCVSGGFLDSVTSLSDAEDHVREPVEVRGGGSHDYRALTADHVVTAKVGEGRRTDDPSLATASVWSEVPARSSRLAHSDGVRDRDLFHAQSDSSCRVAASGSTCALPHVLATAAGRRSVRLPASCSCSYPVMPAVLLLLAPLRAVSLSIVTFGGSDVGTTPLDLCLRPLCRPLVQVLATSHDLRLCW